MCRGVLKATCLGDRSPLVMMSRADGGASLGTLNCRVPNLSEMWGRKGESSGMLSLQKCRIRLKGSGGLVLYVYDEES